VNGRLLYEPPLGQGPGYPQVELKLHGKRTVYGQEGEVYDEEFSQVRTVDVSADGTFKVQVRGATHVSLEKIIRPTAGIIGVPYEGAGELDLDRRPRNVLFDVMLRKVDVAVVKVSVKDRRTNGVPPREQAVLECRAGDDVTFRGVAGGMWDDAGTIVFSVPHPGDAKYQAVVRSIPGRLKGSRSPVFDKREWPSVIELAVEALVPGIRCQITWDRARPESISCLWLEPIGIKAYITRESTCTFYNVPAGRYSIVCFKKDAAQQQVVVEPPCEVVLVQDMEHPVEVKVNLRTRPVVSVKRVALTGLVRPKWARPKIACLSVLGGIRNVFRPDEGGRFATTVLPGSYIVEAEAECFVPFRKLLIVEEAGVELDIELEPKKVLSGHVTNTAGQPVAGTTVMTADLATGEKQTVYTSDDGSYKLCVQPSKLLIVAGDLRQMMYVGTVKVVDDMSLGIALQEGALVKVECKLPDFGGKNLVAFFPQGRLLIPAGGGRLDERGRVECRVLPGSYDVVVYFRGVSYRVGHAVIQEGAENILNFGLSDDDLKNPTTVGVP